MKTFLHILILLSVSCGTAYAQNSVVIKQHGSGNKATVSQGYFSSKITEDSCNKAFKNRASAGNKIIIRKVDGQQDTLLYITGRQQNSVTRILANEELNASQSGKKNALSIIMPDTQKAYKRFNSTQKGSENQISAKLNDSIHNITLSQRGNKNNMAINPCAGRRPRANDRHNSMKIQQKGKGNSAVIIQH